jgi:hypothetical protein
LGPKVELSLERLLSAIDEARESSDLTARTLTSRLPETLLSLSGRFLLLPETPEDAEVRK